MELTTPPRVRGNYVGRHCLALPSTLSLLLAAASSPSLPPGPQASLTRLLTASLPLLPYSATALVSLPLCVEGMGSPEEGVAGLLLSRLACCLVPGRQVTHRVSSTLSQMAEGELKASVKESVEDGAAEEDAGEARGEVSVSQVQEEEVGEADGVGVAATLPERARGGGEQESVDGREEGRREEERADAVEANVQRRLALFLHKREDESAHEVCPTHL